MTIFCKCEGERTPETSQAGKATFPFVFLNGGSIKPILDLSVSMKAMTTLTCLSSGLESVST